MTLFNARKAFTLIELLIVVAIIAILAAIAVPNFLEAQTRAKVSRAMADEKTLATALEAYRVDYSHYPPCWYTQPRGLSNWYNGWLPRLTPLTTPAAYITSIPEDPFIIGTQFYRDRIADGSADYNRVYGYAEDYFGYYDEAVFPKGLEDPFGNDVGWVLQSIGPDTWYSWQDESWSGEPFSINRFKMPYDPTNGTVSNGDILRYGGSGNEGNGRGIDFPEYNPRAASKTN